MFKLLKKLVREEQGQDVVEYALLVAGIGLTIFAGLDSFGDAMITIYSDIAAAITALI